MLRLLLPLMAVLCLAACFSEDPSSAPAAAPKNAGPVMSNLTPRMTADGEIVDAHDGRVIKFGDQYYWYGTHYGQTNGFTKANHYVGYRSKDLITWEPLGRLMPEAPAGVYYRPHVIHRKADDKYILWYNWYPELWGGHFGVAISDRPEGPFEIVSSDVKVANSELGVGDFGLFVDDEETAYISYNTIDGHRVSVEKLSPDYLGSTMENGGYIAQYCEAGSMFKRNDLYYLLTDYTCCFCNQGAGARVYISDDPLGEWTLTNNINRRPGWPAPKLTDGVSFTTDYTPLKRLADTTFESLVLELEPGENDGVQLWFFTGNRSGQCGEVEVPDVHQRIVRPSFEFEYYDHGWRELPISDVWGNSQNMVEQLGFGFNTTADFSRIRITPKRDFPYAEVRLNEVSDNVTAAYVTNRQPGPIIIPAQQTYVMELPTEAGTKFIWMGDLWGSASDNVKGHDYQYWSSPLQFDDQGWIKPLKLEGEWTLGK